MWWFVWWGGGVLLWRGVLALRVVLVTAAAFAAAFVAAFVAAFAAAFADELFVRGLFLGWERVFAVVQLGDA